MTQPSGEKNPYSLSDSDREAQGIDPVEQAASRFSSGLNCAQAVFSSHADQLGLDRDTALKVASAFGGGMARLGNTCGAVTGALMAIGLRHGTNDGDDEKAKETCYLLARRFVDEFTSRHGSIRCNTLVGHDVSVPEERAAAKEEGIFATLCPKLVRDAAEIVGQILG
jgi:C_GCAxxG_C_C family probable redox protein